MTTLGQFSTHYDYSQYYPAGAQYDNTTGQYYDPQTGQYYDYAQYYAQYQNAQAATKTAAGNNISVISCWFLVLNMLTESIE